MEIEFGTAGLRGLTDAEITEELCWQVGVALGKYFGESKTLCLGYDTRPGADRLAGICAAAMESTGVTVVNLGVAPSPLVCAMIYKKKYDGGLMVTGSHLPYDRIGLIPLDSVGAIPPKLETEKIALLAKEIIAPAHIHGQLPVEENFTYDYLEFIQHICGSQLPGKGIKLALDTAGATGAEFIPRLMNDLGCNVHDLITQDLISLPERWNPGRTAWENFPSWYLITMPISGQRMILIATACFSWMRPVNQSLRTWPR
ncbi:MAG: hypothetical protein Q7J68_08415 [Thermoplasmata archaeon]|nr:hypothetical protein [Thermoplasmata archaeon]